MGKFYILKILTLILTSIKTEETEDPKLEIQIKDLLAINNLHSKKENRYKIQTIKQVENRTLISYSNRRRRNLQAFDPTKNGDAGQKITMKVWVDVSLLSGIKQYKGGEGAFQVIVGTLIPSVIEHISQTYTVLKKKKIYLYSRRCGDIDNIGPYYRAEIEGDLVIFLYYVNKNMGAVAYASSCQYDSDTGRPIAGQVVINLFHMNDFRKSNFENNFMTILHEIHHVLGFSPFFFSKFVMPGTSNKLTVYDVYRDFRGTPFTRQIVLKPVLEWARIHYACPTLTGVPVENTGSQGTLGAHWDKAIAANDLMGPTEYSNPVFGELTMKFMEGTGYYQVNYNLAEHFWWGKNSGCGIFSGNCNTNPMTCERSGIQMCSYDYFATGSCKEDSYAEACPIFSEAKSGDCRFESNNNPNSIVKETTYYGIGSRCIMGKIGAGTKIQYTEYPNCLKAKCVGGNTVVIQVEGISVNCIQSFKVMYYKSGSSRYIRCPNIEDFCKFDQRSCKNECNHNGRCLKNGKCWCFFGFGGDDCGKANKHVYQYQTKGKLFSELISVRNILIGIFVILCCLNN